MSETPPPSPRIATLDIIRGIAVMGILAMNIVGFADVPAAYINPLAQTAPVRTADLITYGISFVAIDGKMRGLFSLLFGASLYLLAQKMTVGLVRRRLLILLGFGWLHFLLIWYGDILIGYSLIGFLALAMRNLSIKALIRWAIGLIILQFVIFLVPAGYAHWLAEMMRTAPTADIREQSDAFTRDTAVPDAAHRASVLALYGGPWIDLVHHQVTEKYLMPVIFTFMFGAETLALMLLGMAGMKSGLLTGEWERGRYRRWAVRCLAIAVPLYLVFLGMIVRDGYSVPALFTWGFAATVLARPLMVIAYACLIILAIGAGGALLDRVAAAGRAAFTNYLGTSILMTFVFYGWGLGLFGKLGRLELVGVVLTTAGVMLLWSKPWLDRFRYGPFEWAWRSLTFGRFEPLRR